MKEKMVVTTITGTKFTFDGDVVEHVKKYFATPNQTSPLGWVGVEGNIVNFNHVVHVEFKFE